MKCHNFSLRVMSCLILGLGLLWVSVSAGASTVVINEIHYHPVEEAAFDANGLPVLDLSEDVHEFVELFNPANTSVSLAGWELSGGVHFVFPEGVVFGPQQYLDVARNPARYTAIP